TYVLPMTREFSNWRFDGLVFWMLMPPPLPRVALPTTSQLTKTALLFHMRKPLFNELATRQDERIEPGLQLLKKIPCHPAPEKVTGLEGVPLALSTPSTSNA